ncbi:hypothetical protein EJB05_45148 [Eragrostis curvula]|uniref:Serine/threonine-protein phosphatase 4 regulatory subunit 2 n=1 Tax=Eragrostis curvula TaxID=38414 RepID=A0A5J9TJT3_9POAL|nr:hypothetical protein EJB05_45148 [Eragrostis curvula]
MEGAATENAAAPVGVAAPEAAVDADKRVEVATVEDPATPTVVPEAEVGDVDQVIEDAAPEDGKHRDTEVHVDVTPEEMRSIIEVIADTGKFWHDWSFLKCLLSLQLKQALAEYPEAQMISQEDGEQQRSLSGETYSELVNRLNDALLRFEEGPPFTLQRLCEILLDPKGTYKKLSKLAWALEKNLLVTSTMTKCTDPYPAAHGGPLSSEDAQTTENIGAVDAVDVEPESVPEPTGAVPNGTEHAGGDGDEEMADAEAEEVSCSRDVEMQEEKPDQVSSVNPDANADAVVATEAASVSEPSSNPQS